MTRCSIRYNSSLVVIVDFYYGPLHFSRTDAAAEAIIRARDFGIKAGHLRKKNSDIYKDWTKLFEHLNISVCAK